MDGWSLLRGGNKAAQREREREKERGLEEGIYAQRAHKSTAQLRGFCTLFCFIVKDEINQSKQYFG